MKILLSTSALIILCSLFSVESGLTSCTKDKTVYDTVRVTRTDTITLTHTDTVTVKDTVIIKDSLTKTEMLSGKEWQIDELWRNVAGTNTHYLRNGENTTGIDYSNIRLTFNENGTGTYIDEVGTTHTTTWQLTGPNMFDATLTIGPPSAQTFTWSLVEITEKSFTSTNAIGSDFLLTVRYVPVQ